jgi:UMF1 family MFS transporter
MTHAPQGDRRRIFAWCMYDWANSAFTTLVVTFIYSTYFANAIAPDEITGTTLWSRAVSFSALAIALLSPILGAMADRGGTRRGFLVATSLTCIVATAALAFVAPGSEGAILTALVLFVVANVGFEVGMVFYNSFLLHIAPPGQVGRISGYAWGLGYIGGVACMVLALLGFVGLGDNPGFLGLDTSEGFHVRATNLLVAGWFFLFAIPTFLWVRGADDPLPGTPLSVKGAFLEIRDTVREVGTYRQVARFLLARMIYNDGLVTIFAFGGIYAMGTFGMSFSDVIVFGIALNVSAGAGAFVFGHLEDRVGARRTVLFSIVALILTTLMAVLGPTVGWLWAAGILIGLCAGPNQSSSRSMLARMVPRKKQGEFFGLYAMSGKLTAFVGPLALGIATDVFGNQRAGVASILVLFVVGGALLLLVDEEEGVATARALDAAEETA